MWYMGISHLAWLWLWQKIVVCILTFSFSKYGLLTASTSYQWRNITSDFKETAASSFKIFPYIFSQVKDITKAIILCSDDESISYCFCLGLRPWLSSQFANIRITNRVGCRAMTKINGFWYSSPWCDRGQHQYFFFACYIYTSHHTYYRKSYENAHGSQGQESCTRSDCHDLLMSKYMDVSEAWDSIKFHKMGLYSGET